MKLWEPWFQMPNKNRKQFFHRKGNKPNCWAISKICIFPSVIFLTTILHSIVVCSVFTAGSLATEKRTSTDDIHLLYGKQLPTSDFIIYLHSNETWNRQAIDVGNSSGNILTITVLRAIVVVISKFCFSFEFLTKLPRYMISLIAVGSELPLFI